MFEAVLVDFYGTIVHEDDLIVRDICTSISATMTAPTDPQSIGRYWWEAFSASVAGSVGDAFRCQRDLEFAALLQTIEYFSSSSDAGVLSQQLFDHWTAPPVFADARTFLDRVSVPVVVLSNIDRRDIDAAIACHGMTFERVVASDEVRAYKPHPAMFAAGLRASGVSDARKVLHVGDSLVSDVEGANRFGIPVAWLNRAGRAPRGSARPDHVAATMTDLLDLFDPR